MSKLYIAGMSNDNDSEDLKILLNPIIEYTDGLQWVHHVNDISDFKKQDYLELTKGMGRIIYSEWCQRYNHSRNLYLFQGSMKTGDWFINLDSLEILKPDFFKKWGFLKELLENNNIDGVVLYGKRFLYRFSEFLEHKGNPHEYIVGNNTTIELTTIQEFSNTDWFWGSRRSEKRNEFHFVLHYLKYYCLPNSNHCLLGCENNIEKYKEQELIRREFRLYLEKHNMLPIGDISFQWLCNRKLHDIKDFINKSKILNDAYRYLVLGKTDFKDDHDFNNLIKI